MDTHQQLISIQYRLLTDNLHDECMSMECMAEIEVDNPQPDEVKIQIMSNQWARVEEHTRIITRAVQSLMNEVATEVYADGTIDNGCDTVLDILDRLSWTQDWGPNQTEIGIWDSSIHTVREERIDWTNRLRQEVHDIKDRDVTAQ